MKEATQPQSKNDSKKFNVLGKKSLAEMIDRSLVAALKAHLSKSTAEQRKLIRVDVRRDFIAMMDSCRSVRGQSKSSFLESVESSRQQLLKERATSQREVNDLRRQMEVLRTSAAESARLAKNAEQQSQKSESELAAKIRELFGEKAGAGDLAQLQEKIIALASNATRTERVRMHEANAEGSAEKVSMLERRIAKLTKSLEDSESALKNLAKMKNIDTGIASIYDGVQGLSDDDDNVEAKREMLGAIFKANVDLQKKDAANEPQAGAANSMPKRMQAAAAAEPKAEVAPEPKAEVVVEPKAEAVAEPKAEVVAEPKAEVVAEPKAEFVAEPQSPKAPEVLSEAAAVEKIKAAAEEIVEHPSTYAKSSDDEAVLRVRAAAERMVQLREELLEAGAAEAEAASKVKAALEAEAVALVKAASDRRARRQNPVAPVAAKKKAATKNATSKKATSKKTTRRKSASPKATKKAAEPKSVAKKVTKKKASNKVAKKVAKKATRKAASDQPRKKCA